MTRTPKGLAYEGKKLWRAITDEFDLDDSPDKLRILTDACKIADVIDRLDKEAEASPLVVKGSYGQPVIHPCLSQAQSSRALLAQHLARLNLEDS
nr:hypothetical protein [Tsukamurella paurometabola]